MEFKGLMAFFVIPSKNFSNLLAMPEQDVITPLAPGDMVLGGSRKGPEGLTKAEMPG